MVCDQLDHFHRAVELRSRTFVLIDLLLILLLWYGRLCILK